MTTGYFSARAVGGALRDVALRVLYSERHRSTGSVATGGPVNRLLFSFLGNPTNGHTLHHLFHHSNDAS